MSEFYFEAPTEEERSTTYNGMTLEEFKQLDDESIAVLREEARLEWFAACKNTGGFEDPKWWEARDKTGVFSDFCRWRKHGVPDCDISEDEFLERMYYYVDSRRAKDPTYGRIEPADTEHLTEAEKELAWFARHEAWEDGVSMAGQPTIQAGGSIHFVEERLCVTLDDLVEKGFLETYTVPADMMFKESTGYILAGKFATHMFAQRYPAKETS